MAERSKPGLRDLVLRAAADPEFAQMLITDPKAVGPNYGLDDAQIERIREFAQLPVAELVQNEEFIRMRRAELERVGAAAAY